MDSSIMRESSLFFTETMYNFLLKLYKYRGKAWWNYLWINCVVRTNKNVRVLVHGFSLVVNSGYSYPLFARLFHDYNNPLLQLAYCIHQKKQGRLSIVDVGAAVGDTLFFIEANIKNSIGYSVCIDGDLEFFGYLKENTQQLSSVKCINAVLSDNDSILSNELIRTHSGSASAQGNNKVQTATLDSLIRNEGLEEIDLLKIDVDGSDGKVLQGATEIIRKYLPHIIFEWHPLLYLQTENNILQPYKVLIDSGYDRFLFFTKFGNFSHFMTGCNESDLNNLASLCIRNKFYNDWHYDVIALHNDHSLNLFELAECIFSKNKKSPY